MCWWRMCRVVVLVWWCAGTGATPCPVGQVQVPGAKKCVWYRCHAMSSRTGTGARCQKICLVWCCWRGQGQGEGGGGGGRGWSRGRGEVEVLHLPPSTFHPPPSTLHPPPCTGCFVVGYRYRFRFFLCFINLCNSFIRTSPEYLREIPEFKGQVQNIWGKFQNLTDQSRIF